MSNTLGRDILIQTPDPGEAASFYVKELGFEITSTTSEMISLHGTNINLFIEQRSYPWPRAGSYRRANADVVIGGHDHHYARFAPQDPSGTLILSEASANSSSVPEARTYTADWQVPSATAKYAKRIRSVF
jgi:hypothetical protein